MAPAHLNLILLLFGTLPVPVFGSLPAPTGGPFPVGETAGASPLPVVQRKLANARTSARSVLTDQIPPPPTDDRDHDRILRLQDALRSIVHNVTLERLQVGLRVIEARSGRLFYGSGAESLMDPASNQKVLATTTALMRLGPEWCFRTDVYGPAPDADGVVHGNLFLRGNGDPTLRSPDLDDIATSLIARGVTRVEGGIMADPRRIGDDAPVAASQERPALAVNRGIVAVVVRPGPAGEAPSVGIDPAPPSDGRGAPLGLVIKNSAVTRRGRRGRLAVTVNAFDGVLRVEVSGRIAPNAPGLIVRRRVAQVPLAAAIMLRASLIRAGVSVQQRASMGTRAPKTSLLATRESQPLTVLLRKINKDSDNDEAERLLEAVGAEMLGGAATTEKGLTVLREVLGELGLDPRSYLPQNGSGLGHGNRITAHAMTELLRALYLDPRVGPELLQSLSVGGVDGTTRNRFRGTPVAGYVRAKTGTLNGKSCLSGLVGDRDDVVVFSIMVQGFRSRNALGAVRGAQVAAVETMMRFIRERGGTRIDLPAGFDQMQAATDYEPGEDVTESEGEAAVPSLEPRADDDADEEGVTVLADGAPVAPVRRGRLGLALMGSLSGGDATSGLAVWGGWGTPDVGWGLDLSFLATSYRTLEGPGVGVSDWTRFAGTVGARYRLLGPPFALDVHANTALGWFWVRGRNYDVNTVSRTFALGLGGGIRLSWERHRVAPWVGLDTLGWFGDHTIEAVGVSDTRPIPAVDVMMSIGASMRIW